MGPVWCGLCGAYAPVLGALAPGSTCDCVTMHTYICITYATERLQPRLSQPLKSLVYINQIYFHQ